MSAATATRAADGAPSAERLRRPLQPHGTTARAKGRPWAGVPPCTCDPCRDEICRYKRGRVKLRQIGQPGRLPARLAAQRVRALMAAGMTWAQISAAASVGCSTITKLLRDDARVTISTHMKILAVPVPAVRKPSSRLTDATGTRRRVQALMRAGWSSDALAPHLGFSPSRVSQLASASVQASVTFAVRDRVAVLYRRLENTPGVSLTSMQRAERKGWLRPVDWDGLDMDDPEAQSVPEPRATRAVVVAEEADFLESQGLSQELIAAQLGMSVNTLQIYRARAKAPLRDPGADVAHLDPEDP